MEGAERLRRARDRVNRACDLLEGASAFRLAACLPLLEDALRQLGGMSAAVPGDRAEAAALARDLAAAGALAREAAVFYRECGRTPSGIYTAAGGMRPDYPAARTLAEV